MDTIDFFANISEIIYCMEINVQIKNKTDKSPRSLVFLMNLVRPIIPKIEIFPRISYFRTLYKFVLFPRVFCEYHKFDCSYETYEQNQKNTQLSVK